MLFLSLFLLSLSTFADREPVSAAGALAPRYQAANDDGVEYAAETLDPGDPTKQTLIAAPGNNLAYMGVQDFGGGNVKYIYRLRSTIADPADESITVTFTQGVPSKTFTFTGNDKEIWFTIPVPAGFPNVTATAQFESRSNPTSTANFTASIGKQVNIPIDGGLGILMLAGLGYGLYKRKEEQ